MLNERQPAELATVPNGSRQSLRRLLLLLASMSLILYSFLILLDIFNFGGALDTVKT